jgi:hypothetical protein
VLPPNQTAKIAPVLHHAAAQVPAGASSSA